MLDFDLLVAEIQRTCDSSWTENSCRIPNRNMSANANEGESDDGRDLR